MRQSGETDSRAKSGGKSKDNDWLTISRRTSCTHSQSVMIVCFLSADECRLTHD